VSFWDRKSGVHWSCYVLLLTDFVNYWTYVCHAQRSHLSRQSFCAFTCRALTLALAEISCTTCIFRKQLFRSPKFVLCHPTPSKKFPSPKILAGYEPGSRRMHLVIITSNQRLMTHVRRTIISSSAETTLQLAVTGPCSLSTASVTRKQIKLHWILTKSRTAGSRVTIYM